MKKNYLLPTLLSILKFHRFFLLITLGLLCSISSFGQTTIENKEFLIKSKIIEVEESNINNIEISWDFSNSTNSTILNLEIEIQPISDCWNGLDGMNRSEMISKSFKDISQHPKGKLLLTLKEYNAKCFKWRTKTSNSSTGQEHYTDWQFSSFL